MSDHRQLNGLHALHVEGALLVQGHQVGGGDHRHLVDRLESTEARALRRVAGVFVRGDPNRALGAATAERRLAHGGSQL
jgi:hypothetical protein